MATTTDLEKLVINYLTQDQYDDAREAGTLNANELYLTPDTGSTGGTVTSVATGGGLTGGPITSSGTISHDDTSSQSSVSNSGRTYIQSVTLDTYGHVTGLTSASESVTNSDEKLGTDAVTSGTTYYIVAGTNTTGAERKKYDASGIAYKATNGTANGTNGEALLTLGNSTASTSANWKAGKIFLYSSSAYGGTLVPEAVTSPNKTWTLPNKTGTVALTSDIPTKTSNLTNDSGFVTSSGVTSIATTSPISGGTITSTGTISHAASGVGTAVTTAGFYKFKYDTYGHVTGVSAVQASDITGLVTIPTNTDENVKSLATATTAASSYYITGSSSSSDTTGTLNKHAAAYLYMTANNTTGGYAQLRLGNTTATSSSGGKEGQIRLYGTNATYYLDLKPGAIASSNKTITFPNATGTVALTSDIPTIPSTTGSSTTGITVSAHSTGTVRGVKSNTNTTASKASGGNGSAPSLTVTPTTVANSITGAIDSSDSTMLVISLGTTSVGSASDWSAGSASTWSFTDVTVPIRADSDSTFVTSTTHTVNDSGHTHSV